MLVVLVEVVVVAVAVPVVVSSRQPHQPGVLHVSVRVRVLVEVEEELVDVGLVVEVVELVVPLLSYIFQFAQSRHSGVNLHSATRSYFIMTSLITDRILCVPMPTRHPLSATTSYTHSRPVWHADSIAYPAYEHEAVAPLHVPM